MRAFKLLESFTLKVLLISAFSKTFISQNQALSILSGWRQICRLILVICKVNSCNFSHVQSQGRTGQELVFKCSHFPTTEVYLAVEVMIFSLGQSSNNSSGGLSACSAGPRACGEGGMSEVTRGVTGAHQM